MNAFLRRCGPLVLGATLACVLLAGGALRVLRPRAVVTMSAARTLQCGMTEAEVEAVFGGPAGDYRTGPTDFEYVMGLGFDRPIPCYTKTWQGDECKVVVYFEETTGTCIGSARSPLRPRPANWWERVKFYVLRQ
jgi:hypothetical protein